MKYILILAMVALCNEGFGQVVDSSGDNGWILNGGDPSSSNYKYLFGPHTDSCHYAIRNNTHWGYGLNRFFIPQYPQCYTFYYYMFDSDGNIITVPMMICIPLYPQKQKP